MPFESNSNLPKNVTNVLPKHAQDIYREAFNRAYDEYKDPDERRDDESREQVAHRVAWSAVKQSYEKSQDDKWHARS